jgi:hypothetical protein
VERYTFLKTISVSHVNAAAAAAAVIWYLVSNVHGETTSE